MWAAHTEDVTTSSIVRLGTFTSPWRKKNYDALIDEAEHTFFHCETWRLERRKLEAKVDASTIKNLCDVILSNKENWISIAS